jgi:hypothetical protein
MLSHEQSLADRFNAFMQNQGKDRGIDVHAFSLDGQDRDAGADYVLMDTTRFALVEFKYSEANLVSEAHKPRRLVLCKQLALQSNMRALHDRCHFVAWTEPPSSNVRVNVYRHEICTTRVFNQSFGFPADDPLLAKLDAGTFAERFLGQSTSNTLTYSEFESYVAWLLTETSGSKKSTIELVASNVDANELSLIRLSSLAEAHSWLQSHRRSPKLRPRPGNGG